MVESLCLEVTRCAYSGNGMFFAAGTSEARLRETVETVNCGSQSPLGVDVGSRAAMQCRQSVEFSKLVLCKRVGSFKSLCGPQAKNTRESTGTFDSGLQFGRVAMRPPSSLPPSPSLPFPSLPFPSLPLPSLPPAPCPLPPAPCPLPPAPCPLPPEM